jgi:hypothetical protein
MANSAAESPFVKMRVHSLDLAVPANMASSSFVMPRMLLRSLPSVFLASLMFFDWCVSPHPGFISFFD